VWGATLPLTDAALATVAANLSRDELLRAERFRFDRDRRNFIAARGILRVVLARYVGLAEVGVDHLVRSFQAMGTGLPWPTIPRNWACTTSPTHDDRSRRVVDGNKSDRRIDFWRQTELDAALDHASDKIAVLTGAVARIA
jgi:hypothetical protein